jgi:hypothetical protein
MTTEKQPEEGYRKMASDREHEREAEEWCDALIGDAYETARESFHKLDKLNSEPFPPAERQPAAPKREIFK